MARNQQYSSLRRLKVECQQHDIVASKSTLSRALLEQNIGAYMPHPVNLLKPEHPERRVKFAYRILGGDLSHSIDNILFTDESKFTLGGNGSRMHRMKRRDPKVDPPHIEPKRAHETYVMVFGGISAQGRTGLTILSDQRMDSKMYIREVLKPMEEDISVLFPPIGRRTKTNRCREWVLMQDGCPAHKAIATSKWLNSQPWVYAFMDNGAWPANSPDMNPIENLWMLLGDFVDSRNCKTKEQLIQALFDGWDQISEEIVTGLCRSIVHRCEMVVEREGMQIMH